MITRDEVDEVRRAEDERRTDMDIGRHSVQNTAHGIGSVAPGLFRDKRNRVGLINEPQPAGAIALSEIARVKEDPAARKDADKLQQRAEAVQRMLWS